MDVGGALIDSLEDARALAVEWAGVVEPWRAGSSDPFVDRGQWLTRVLPCEIRAYSITSASLKSFLGALEIQLDNSRNRWMLAMPALPVGLLSMRVCGCDSCRVAVWPIAVLVHMLFSHFRR